MAKAKVGLADVQCSRLQFLPGDRVLVKVYHTLDRDSRRKLEKSVKRWAGTDVEVLVYNATQMEITIDRKKNTELFTG